LSEYHKYDYGFGSVWENVYVERRAGYYSSVTDYHKHDFYEINLILSGNIKVLLKDRSEEGSENRIVLTRPNTAHFISCNPDTLYSRIYLVFTDDFIANHFAEWHQLSIVFGKNGTILTLNERETNLFKHLIEQIENENSILRQRLLIYYLLSKISDRLPQALKCSAPQPYIFEALMYLESHYGEKINFTDLARQFYIGRTTLMTRFKVYTGDTLGEYLTKCRLKNAIRLLLAKNTIEYTSEKCGFSDSSGLIRAFKRHYNTTPYQYIKRIQYHS